MKFIQRVYIHDTKNIDSYFITFNEDQQEETKVIDDIIYIKGKESLINILYKTVKACEYLIKNNYTYIIRSNISTLINFNNLYNYLKNCPRTLFYSGGTLEIMKWWLSPHELSEDNQCDYNKYFNLKYIQGNAIILSNDIIKWIIENEQKYDIVDDVKLGIIIRDNFPQIKILNLQKCKMICMNH